MSAVVGAAHGREADICTCHYDLWMCLCESASECALFQNENYHKHDFRENYSTIREPVLGRIYEFFYVQSLVFSSFCALLINALPKPEKRTETFRETLVFL